ncbi:MAG TPA: UDP-N-acetylmuramate dehydrogenase [Balneolales bacterium]|nr:UDP-N-acetylmuramate dehydrogenase [Balneolales bacterium]
MKIYEDYPLKNLNTLGVNAKASLLAEITNEEQLIEIICDNSYNNMNKMVLGGGSNVLFVDDFQGLILKMDIKDISVIKKDNENVWVKAGAGVLWHDLVIYCVQHNYAGVENLSFIPGTVGAAPLQNIGAYGVEIKDVFDSLEAIDLKTGEKKLFRKEDCKFGYRDSVFKHELKGRYVITSVVLRLNKKPVFNLSYGTLQSTLEEMGYDNNNITIKAVSDAVIKIRKSKLPDPDKIGNAGSFFKNPEILKSRFEKLKLKYKSIPGYPVDTHKMKVPAGWLIQQCGWKGKAVGNTGTYKNQALVLVNHGGASGREIFNLSSEIRKSVKDKFDITLEREVNVV